MAALPKAGALAAGLGALWLLTRGSSPASAAGLPAGQVARTRTAPATRSAWIGSRLAAARAALQGRVPEASRESIARDLVAHWIRETGASNEYDFNVGNLTAGAHYRGAWFLYNPPSVTKFRAYASLGPGVTDYVNLVSGRRYAASWATLLASPDDPATWQQQLVSAGYSGANSPADLAEIAREIPQFRAEVDAWVASNGG